jgi:hypothetical protein
MKITLNVASGKDLRDNYIYWHITAEAQGVEEDEPRIAETLQMLWDRLSAGYKGYARLSPEIRSDKAFVDNEAKVIGYFRLTTTPEKGELIARGAPPSGFGQENT